MSHQVRVSGVHQINADSNLVQMLGLGHSATVSGSTRPAASCWVPPDLCVEVGSQSHQGEARAHQTQADQYLAMGRESSAQ